MINLAEIQPEIEHICKTMPVKRLCLFGSALTHDFKTDSDVDVLVTFDTAQDVDLFSAYFELKECLEDIFKRKIDLTVDGAFKNPIFKSSVEKTRTVIYAR
ncbi:MAG: nucleotidyltransferase domain-containing protein [Deltaproteobacteria bacterium]|nr:nucleotidyltransferase domain-containing protein [Deltaproteobacteria bacterium]